METSIDLVPDKVFDFDFEISLKDKLEIVWGDYSCLSPLRLCSWREDEYGVLHEEN